MPTAHFIVFSFFLFCSGPIEQCVFWDREITAQVDLAFNVFFMMYFFLRVRSGATGTRSPLSKGLLGTLAE